MAKRWSRRRLLEDLRGASVHGRSRARRLGRGSSRKRGSVSAIPHGLRKQAGINSIATSGGRLIKVRSPLADCVGGTPDATCEQVFKELKNPYYLGDEVGLTQSLGWVGAWTSEPSVYAVAAKTTQDVVAAVNFARTNNLRLVVKGGGHSYQGTSNAADSLLIWTRHMNAVTLHDAFVGAGCAGKRGAATGRLDRARRDLGTCVQPGDDQGRPLRARRRLHDGRGRRPHSGRRVRQLLEGLWTGRSEPLGGGSRDRRRRRQNRQRLHESRSLLGAEGRRRRVRNRHPRHAAHARAAGIHGRRVRDDQGVVRRGLSAPHRESPRILRTGAFQSALGRAARLRSGRDLVDFDGAPRPRPATGRRDVASLLRLGLSVRRRISALFRRQGSSASRRAFSGTPPRSRSSRPGPRRTTARTRRPTISSGRATSKRRVGSGTPTNPPGCPSRCFRTISASALSTRCLRRRSIGASRCISTRGSPARPRTRSPRPGIRR